MSTIAKLVLALLIFQLATTAYAKAKEAKPGDQPKHKQPGKPANIAKPDHIPTPRGKKYCVKGPDNSGKSQVGIDEDNQEMYDSLCIEKNVDCNPTYKGGVCNSLGFNDKISYAMNAYYVAKGRKPSFCKGKLTTVNPSKGKCIFH